MKYDCIIVLANEMDSEGNLNSESTGRIQLAIGKFFELQPDKLITCGWNYRNDCDLYIGDVMKEFASKNGVPPECIVVERNSRDTVGDAFLTKVNILNKTGWKNILVVTSDYHVKRSETIFNFVYGPHYFITVIGAQASDSDEKLASENKSLEAFKRTFENVDAGNDENIFRALSSSHAFYNGTVYPKLELGINEN